MFLEEILHCSKILIVYKRIKIVCSSAHKTLVEIKDLLVFMVNKMPDVLSGTIILVTSQKRSITFVLCTQKVRPLEILFYDKIKALTDIKR